MLEAGGLGYRHFSPLASQTCTDTLFSHYNCAIIKCQKRVPEKVYTENGKIATFFTPSEHLKQFPVL